MAIKCGTEDYPDVFLIFSPGEEEVMVNVVFSRLTWLARERELRDNGVPYQTVVLPRGCDTSFLVQLNNQPWLRVKNLSSLDLEPDIKSSTPGPLPLVWSYQLGYDAYTYNSVILERRHCPDGYSWAIRKGEAELSKIPNESGWYVFNYPPLPSYRGPSWFEEHRWHSAQEGYQFWVTNREKIIATTEDHRRVASQQREGRQGKE